MSPINRTFGRFYPAWLLLACVSSCLVGCTTNPDHSTPDSSTTLEPQTLSEYGFFVGPLKEHDPAPGVIPYTVNAPLWADNAFKGRFLVLPAGHSMKFNDLEDWEFPLGTILIKSFYFDMDHTLDEGPYRIVETRLLVLQETGWTSRIYVWNSDETEAFRSVAGEDVWVDYIDSDGKPAEQLYLVPNKNQCGSCHERDDVLLPLGLVTRQMNRDVELDDGNKNQLDLWEQWGMFGEAIPKSFSSKTLVNPYDENQDLDWRARSWLDGNCAHCHRPGSGGGSTGLDLRSTVTSATKLGVCKSPVAAGSGAGGFAVDILPGQPDKSILMYRISTLDPEIKMPELPNLQVDEGGNDLIYEWILAMEPSACGEELE